MRKQSRHQLRGIIYSLALLFPATLLVGGCMSLGPDFVKPEVAEEDDWLVQNKEISTESPDQTAWWKIFNDPVLDVLVEKAYEQNLPLQIAGLRIFEARAQLGIAVGLQYPQTQTVGGGQAPKGSVKTARTSTRRRREPSGIIRPDLMPPGNWTSGAGSGAGLNQQTPTCQ
jgi:outer membrane protein TolC